MEQRNGHVFESFDPDEPAEEIRRVNLHGWIKVRSHSGRVTVLQVEEVRLLDSRYLEIQRPGTTPLYHWGYLGKTVEPISAAEARAFLDSHTPQDPASEEASDA